jgi:prolyl-tRNA synthetase
MTLGLGASKVGLSGLSPVELWRQSGRFEGSLRAPGHEFFAVRDRPGVEDEEKLILAPTCEEEITTMVKTRIAFGESLPLRLYQIERKYRNEMRPRMGLLRTKEFVMKDLYSFDASQEDALKTYDLVRAVYDGFFEALGVPFLVAKADSGNMGGSLSHEYHYMSNLGEDTVWTCSSCKFTANDEVIVKTEHESTSSCPHCKSSLVPHRTIEVGHTFFLGDRYTRKFDCRVPTSKTQGKDANKADSNFAQMGCYGIGVSRLVGALAALCSQPESKSDQIRIRWPKQIAPFSTVILANKKKHPEDLVAVYDALTLGTTSSNVDAVIDDRPGKSLMFKIGDAEMHGAPVTCVLGQAWEKDQHVEVRIAGEETQVEFVPLEKVRETVQRALIDDTPINVQ